MISEGTESDLLTIPRRQSVVGIVVETAVVLQNIVKTLWPVLLIFLLKAEKHSVLFIVIFSILILGLVFLYGYFLYRNFTFHINEEEQEFVLQSGVFNKQRVMIQLDRIQQVEISQNLIQKLLNVYAVEVNTAGSSKSEAVIKALDHQVAVLLKSRLTDFPATSIAPEVPSSQLPSTFIHLGFSTLSKVAVTSSYGRSIALIIAFLVTIINTFNDFWPNSSNSTATFIHSVNNISVASYAGIIITACILFIFLFNWIRVMVRYFNYKISLKANALAISFGLFNTKSLILYTDKVQMVKTVSNFLQNRMKLRRIFFHQASSDVATDQHARSAGGHVAAGKAAFIKTFSVPACCTRCYST